MKSGHTGFGHFTRLKIRAGFPAPQHLQEAFNPCGKLPRHVVVVIHAIAVEAQEGVTYLV